MSTLKSPPPQAFSVSDVHPRLRKHLARCTLDCGFKTPESPALRGFVAERGPITGTSLYLVLKSNGLHRPENLPVKFGFSPKFTSTNLAKKLPSQTLSQTVSHRDFQLLSQTAHVRSHSRKRVHTRLSEKDRTQGHTRRNRGPSLPRPQHGLVPSAKFLLVLHAFIYIHFPVHCEPSTPAEEKNLSKLPSQTLSQTIFHRVFQLLPQTAHVCFHSRKRVHTRLRQQDRTQRPTRRNTGLPDGAAITTLDTYCTFTNFPGPGIRTANFAALGSWPGGALEERREPAGQRCAYARRCPAGVAAPLGCAALFAIW